MTTPENQKDQNEIDEIFAAKQAAEEAAAEAIEIVEAVEAVGDSVDSPVSNQDQLKQKLVEAEKQVLLAQADLENFRRRTRRDMQDQLKYASLPLMNEILEAVDNLHRAIESHESDPQGTGLLEGVKMVAQQISTVLENKGCKKIDAVGQPFDPNLHQAVQMQPSNEFESNVVMQELRSGFQLHDRVVRPSQVFVSTGPAADSTQE